MGWTGRNATMPGMNWALTVARNIAGSPRLLSVYQQIATRRFIDEQPCGR